MDAIKNFFLRLGFDFKHDFKSRTLTYESNLEHASKFEFSLYYYEAPNQTNTSIYLVPTPLSEIELDIIRKFIWNENKADLVFYTVSNKNSNTLFNENLELNLHYAKATPKNNIEESRIDHFSISQNDEKTNKISRWQFDSGAFWLNYHSFLSNVNQKGIDEELVLTLSTLKDELHQKLEKAEKNIATREEVVQAIIDRTLYIKYLEDNHIINSYFYTHYFKAKNTSYKTLLSNNKTKELNKLFKLIHNIFNNSLFDKPNIKDEYLTKDVCDLLFNSFNTNLKTQQIRLFDFQFNVIPVEFISYIYEIFLSDKQKEGGIYYTPKKLAQLILDDVIPSGKIGRVLDPSCGSGMFLIVAFQKLLEHSRSKTFRNIEQELEFRIKLLSENIFGIEKEITAQRFTIFSLSLQLFRGLDPVKIREYIASQLNQNREVELFKRHSFFNNILCGNSLSLETQFKGVTFDYIVGNPPFFEIKHSDVEIQFIQNYELSINNVRKKVDTLIGKHQISQCFLVKVKDWSNENTRFGFVCNSSNFYNDNSKAFQDFFYTNYQLEKIYELAKVKKILFEKAKESVVALIFNNRLTPKNIIEYFPVDMGLFSEKPFKLLIIQEDKVVKISQNDLIIGKVRLRDFLVGNEFDRELLKTINSNSSLSKYIETDKDGNESIHRGFEIWGSDARKKEFNITEVDWQKYTEVKKEAFLNTFINKYFSDRRNKTYNKEYIKPNNLTPFATVSSGRYISTLENFHRPRTPNIYKGNKLIFTRLGDKLNCIYNKDEIYFDFSVYTLKLKADKHYYLICAILNSDVARYYINNNLRKRVLDSFPRIGMNDIKQVPIPSELDKDLVKKVSKISQDLTEGKYSYTDEVANVLNELIFDLYDLSYLHKQRIRDYFKPKTKTTKSKNELGVYTAALLDTISIYFKNKVVIESSDANFNLVVVKVLFNKPKHYPGVNKTKQYILNEIFKQNPKENFLALQEKIFGKDCVYIIKRDESSNWSETKAFEDGQEILKNIRQWEENI